LLFREVNNANATLIFVSHDCDLSPRFDRTVPLTSINQSA
jgi:putative ABC transport system ATP-binding protein